LGLFGFAIGLLGLVLIAKPNETPILVAFYILAGCLTFCLTTIFSFYIRRLFGRREFLNHYLSISAREGIWLGLIMVTSLYLASKNLFSWINAGFLVLAFLFLESYLLARKKRQN
jgi:hypothetical protein